MRTVVLAVVIAAVLAVPAQAQAPTVAGLQRQVTGLKRQVVALSARLAALSSATAGMAKANVQTGDRITCNYAIGSDNLNLVWHTLVLLTQSLGYPPQPDFPKYDDGGACARLGVSR